MINPFEYKAVPSSVQNEIELRRATPSYGTINLVGDNVGFRLTSMCSECNSKYQLNHVNNFHPNPTVSSIEVKKQGELGTTTKTIVFIDCYNMADLDEIHKCYFVPGMSVRVEFFQRAAMPAAWDTATARLTDNNANAKMMEYTKTKNANYIGMQGLVANHTITAEVFRGTYIWRTTVEIISPSANALNHPTTDVCFNKNTQTIGQQCQTKTNDTGGIVVRSELYSHFKAINLIDYGAFNDDIATFVKNINSRLSLSRLSDYFDDVPANKTPYQHYDFLRYRGPARDVSGMRMIRNYFANFFTNETTILGGNTNETTAKDAYISYGRLEFLINEIVYGGYHGKKDYKSSIIDSSTLELPWDDHYMSTDPRICALVDGVWQKYLFTTSLTDNFDYFLYQQKRYSGVITKKDGTKRLRLHRVLINVVLLEQILNEVESEGGDGLISTFLQKVLNAIAEVTGNVWEFQVTATPPKNMSDFGKDAAAKSRYVNANSHLTVMEIKGMPKTIKPFELPAGQGGSVVIGLDLKMKMTDAMKTQAVYATSRGQSSSNNKNNACSGAAISAFATGPTGFKNLAKITDGNGIPICKDCPNGESQALSLIETLVFYNDGEEGFGLDGGIDKCADIIHTAYKAALNYNIEANGSEFCGGQPLPFTMELKLVGIGGFEFGQLITCEFIPAAIKENFYYQIIAIEQFFRGDGWYTTLVTIPRTKTKKAAAGTGGGWSTYDADQFLKKRKDYKEQVVQTTGAGGGNALPPPIPPPPGADTTTPIAQLRVKYAAKLGYTLDPPDGVGDNVVYKNSAGNTLIIPDSAVQAVP